MAVTVAAGCTPREVAWLIPRASVGVALRTHEGQLAGAGFVTLTSHLEPPARAMRAPLPERHVTALAGAAIPCRVAEACRWEGRARAGTLSDLASDETLGRTP